MSEIRYMPLICRVAIFVMLVFFPTKAPESIIHDESSLHITRRYHYDAHEMLYIQLPLITVNVLIFTITLMHSVIHSASRINNNLKDSIDLVIEHQFYCYAIMITISFATYTKNINDTAFFFTMSAYHALNAVCVFFESKNDRRKKNQNTNHHLRLRLTNHLEYSIFEHSLYVTTLLFTLQIVYNYVPNDINYMHHIVGFTLPEITTITLKSFYNSVREIIK
jgi:hypothetical protein